MPSFEDLHLKSPIAEILTRLGWSPEDPLAKEVAPTAARGHNLVAVTPPTPVYATPAIGGLLSRVGGGGRALLLAPPNQLDEWGALLHRLAEPAGIRLQVAHGTARVVRQLRANTVDVVITGPETALALVGRSALRMESLAALFLAWPESWLEDESLPPLMHDLPKDAQRIIYTAESGRATDLAERYARKALTVEAPGLNGSPAGPVRTAGVPWARRVQALGDLVELLDPVSLVIWTVDRSYHAAIAQAVALHEPEIRVVTGDVPTGETIVAFDLPTAARLRQLLSAGEVVLLVPPGTESYVARIAAPRRPLQLPGAVDAAAGAAAAQRSAIVKVIEDQTWNRSLLTLAPLFERHDPVAVAAALFELWTRSAQPVAPLPADVPATSKVYVGIGKKDGATANDLVAVLTKELKVDRKKIGRIELRDAYSLIEVPAQEAERIAAGLNGAAVRRKRVTARVDRGPTRSPRSARGTAGRAT